MSDVTPIETLPRADLGQLQLERLRLLLARAVRVPLHRERLASAKAGPGDMRSLDDLRRLPFTTKADFRDTYPFGLLAVPMDEVVRIHASSGTTGKATVVAYTRGDLDVWTEVMSRTLRAGGVAPGGRRAERLRVRPLHGGPRLPLRRGVRGRRGHPGVRRLHRAPARRLPGLREHRAVLHALLRAAPGGGDRGGGRGHGDAAPPGRLLRRGALDRSHADGHREPAPPDGAQRLRALGDHGSRRGRGVPRAPGHACRRGPLPAGGHRPEDPGAGASRHDRGARADDAQQAGDAAPPVPDPGSDDARPHALPVRPHAGPPGPHHGQVGRHADHPRRQRVPLAGGARAPADAGARAALPPGGATRARPRHPRGAGGEPAGGGGAGGRRGRGGHRARPPPARRGPRGVGRGRASWRRRRSSGAPARPSACSTSARNPAEPRRAAPAPAGAAQRWRCRRCCARRSASATIVSVGPAVPPVGNTELPATKRFETPCTRPSASTTPSLGSSRIRVVPM